MTGDSFIPGLHGVYVVFEKSTSEQGGRHV
jgi:hypothetical protein